ncbi:hypothetical protein CBA19C6_02670 [Cupriavidus pauculus]|nr:hypothetical protein CBA19C6_02670 [Cupriavidus pauculus]
MSEAQYMCAIGSKTWLQILRRGTSTPEDGVPFLRVTRLTRVESLKYRILSEVLAMKKLIAALVVGLFATGAFAQASAPAMDAAPAAKEAAKPAKTSSKKHSKKHTKKAAVSAPAA